MHAQILKIALRRERLTFAFEQNNSDELLLLGRLKLSALKFNFF